MDATLDVQGIFHLDKGLLGLLKETKDNRLAELAAVLLVVHLQDLIKGAGINAVTKIGVVDGAFLTLSKRLAGCWEIFGRMRGEVYYRA